MGSGSFTTTSFKAYSTSRGRTVDAKGTVTSDNLQDFYQLLVLM